MLRYVKWEILKTGIKVLETLRTRTIKGMGWYFLWKYELFKYATIHQTRSIKVFQKGFFGGYWDYCSNF